MSQKSTRKKLVAISDDEGSIPESPPLAKRNAKKLYTQSEDDAASGDSFINDEAEESEGKSGSDVVESDDGHVQLRDSTPPIQRRRPAKYRLESSDEEGNIPKARHYQADDPASPKKKSTLTPKGRRTVVVSDEEDEDNHRTSPKKGTKELTTNIRRMVQSDEEEDEEDNPQPGSKKARNGGQKAFATPVKGKKMVKVEVASDSDIEIIDPPKSASKTKGNKHDAAQKKAPAKRTPVKPSKKKPGPKSKDVVEDSDEDVIIAASKLAPGDTMYPERKPSKVQPANLKRSLPITPPYKTRASGIVGEQATPSKKPRKNPDNSIGDEELDQPAKKSDLPSTKAEAKTISDDDGDDHDLPGTVERQDSDDEANEEDNVFDAVPTSTKTKSSGSVLNIKKASVVVNQKYTDRRWTALPRPSTCEVFDVNLLDDALNAAKSYDKLAPLRFCDIQNSGSPFTGTLTGTIVWSAWNQVLPERDIAKLVPLLEFQHEGRFVNLSRVDPSVLVGRYMSDTRHELTIDNQTAICISIGCVRESALAPDARFGGPFITRGIRMVLQSYEWERWGATIGEIARRQELKTQLWNFAVTFGTKLIRRDDGPTSTRKVENLPSAFFNTYQSPKKKAATSSSVSLPNFVGQLEFTDEIPVYDARTISKDFKWTASVFANPASYFPLFDLFNNDGEIPSNALCAVGYVTQIYNVPADRDSSGGKGKGKGKAKATSEEPHDLRIAPLIQWVYVLGTL